MKMRLNQIFYRSRHHARAHQNENKVPFKELYPLSLKNSISGGGRKSTEDKCLFEISLLFKCWKDNEFNPKNCQAMATKLQECYAKYLKNASIAKEMQRIDVPVPGATSLTNKQLNYLLRMYPTV